jgi:hypothetical protein
MENRHFLDENRTPTVVQRYLDELAGVRGDSEAGPVILALLSHSARRLKRLCRSLL